jgi:hypothetical protein
MLCSAEAGAAGAQPVNPYSLTRCVGVNGVGAGVKIFTNTPNSNGGRDLVGGAGGGMCGSATPCDTPPPIRRPLTCRHAAWRLADGGPQEAPCACPHCLHHFPREGLDVEEASLTSSSFPSFLASVFSFPQYQSIPSATD